MPSMLFNKLMKIGKYWYSVRTAGMRSSRVQVISTPHGREVGICVPRFLSLSLSLSLYDALQILTYLTGLLFESLLLGA
jgi:hypothetical protein